MKIKVNNIEETLLLGEKLGKLLSPNMVVTLEGQLGAGKTTFTKGVAKGLGITKIVKSPTFTIVREYTGNTNLYHIDAYRLEGTHEDIGFDEYFYSGGVAIVEWARFIEEFLPTELIKIKISYISENEREFEIFADSEKFKNVMEGLQC